MLELHLLIVELLCASLSIFDTQLFEGIIVTTIIVKFFIEVMHNLIASNIQELSGVGYDDDSTFTVADIVLKPHNCI